MKKYLTKTKNVQLLITLLVETMIGLFTE